MGFELYCSMIKSSKVICLSKKSKQAMKKFSALIKQMMVESCRTLQALDHLGSLVLCGCHRRGFTTS